jgi:hypothetical protein
MRGNGGTSYDQKLWMPKSNLKRSRLVMLRVIEAFLGSAPMILCRGGEGLLPHCGPKPALGGLHEATDLPNCGNEFSPCEGRPRASRRFFCICAPNDVPSRRAPLLESAVPKAHERSADGIRPAH